MYLLTLFRAKSYSRLKKYFRTRIACFALLFVSMLTFYISIIYQVKELAVLYDVSEAWILLEMGVPMVLWLAVDFYWNAAIRIYKDSKKGR